MHFPQSVNQIKKSFIVSQRLFEPEEEELHIVHLYMYYGGCLSFPVMLADVIEFCREDLVATL